VAGADHRRVAWAFGAVLRITRNGALLSQERLAELADIDRTTPSLRCSPARAGTAELGGHVRPVLCWSCPAALAGPSDR